MESMPNWILAASYTVHLLATAVWAASLFATVVLALPAWRVGQLDQNAWLAWQKKLVPWVNGSLVLLLVSGFYQMTTDANYSGFLVLDSAWAWAMLVKHVAYAGVVGAAVWLQFGLYPAMARGAVLAQSRPKLAETERLRLAQQEKRLLTINIGLAVLILVCTAVATAV